jgi:hypothetical protein
MGGSILPRALLGLGKDVVSHPDRLLFYTYARCNAARVAQGASVVFGEGGEDPREEVRLPVERGGAWVLLRLSVCILACSP